MHCHRSATIFSSYSVILIALLTALIMPVTQVMANDIERFNSDVHNLTGDWESEPWHFGWLRLHQQNYNEVGDEFYLHLWEEERPKELTAQQVLERSFPESKVGDVDDENIVSMNDAVTLTNGILVKAVTWNSQFGRYTTIFGVIPRPKGGFISYKGQCNHRPYKTETYTGERCMIAVNTLLESLQNGTLRMPDPEAPVSIPGWTGQIEPTGVIRMFYTGWFAGYGANTSPARTSHIYVAPAKSIAALQEKSAVTKFADDTLVSGFGPVSPSQWTDNVLARTQPEAGEGPAIQIAMAVTIPDGRKSMVSLSCWNAEWQGMCMGALKRVVYDLESGFITEKWFVAN